MPSATKKKSSTIAKRIQAPKRVVARMRTINRDIFLQIKDGSKTVETRTATKKYATLAKGDTLIIICGAERLEKKIKKVMRFASIEAMAKEIPYKKIMPSVASLDEMKKVYYSFPGYKEKIKKSGLVAMWLG